MPNRTGFTLWIPAVILTLFYLVASYQTGLFFAPNWSNPIEMWLITFLAALAFVGAFYFNGIRIRMPVWLWLATIYAVYLLITTFWAADPGAAIIGAVTILVSVLVAAYVSTTDLPVRTYVLYMFAALGAGIYVFGIGAVLKWWYYNSVQLSNWMNSIFEYHNTFGAFELTSFVIALGLLETTKKWWSKALTFVIAALNLLGVISSYSRLVWVLSVVVIVGYILLQLIRKRALRALIQTISALIVTVVALPFSISAFPHDKSMMAWATFAVVLIMSVVVALVDDWGVRWVSDKSRSFKVGLGIGAIVIVIVGVLLAAHFASHKLGSIFARIHSIHANDIQVTQRAVYYHDGLKMWLNSPIFGSGWGTWGAKFLAFQAYPYQATQAHSIVIDNLVNGGVIGLGIWLLMLIFTVVSSIRVIRRRERNSAVHLAALIGAITLLLHASMDFDLDFPMVTIAFFMLLGLAGSPNRQEELAEAEDRGKSNATFVSRVSPWTNTAFAIAGVLTVILGVMVSAGQTYYVVAIKPSNQASEQTLLQKSIAWFPYDQMPRLALANLNINAGVQAQQSSQSSPMTSQNTANTDIQSGWKQLQIAERQGLWNPSTQNQAAMLAYKLQQSSTALQWAKQAALDSPFHVENPATYQGIALWTAVSEYKKNPSAAKALFHDITATLQTAKINVTTQQHMTFGYLPSWAYSPSPQMQIYAAAADYALHNTQKSLADLSGLSATSMQNSVDSNTIGLYDVVMLLNDERMGRSAGAAQFKKPVMANAELKVESQYLSSIG